MGALVRDPSQVWENALSACLVRIKACSRNQHNARHGRSTGLCQKESINFDQSMRGLIRRDLCFGWGPACGSRSNHIRKQALHRTKERDEGVEKEEAKIRLYYRVDHYYGWLVLNSTRFSEEAYERHLRIIFPADRKGSIYLWASTSH